MKSSCFVSWDWWRLRGRAVSYGMRSPGKQFFASLCDTLPYRLIWVSILLGERTVSESKS